MNCVKLNSVKCGMRKISKVAKKRLIELGFVPGREIEVLINRGGRMIVLIENEKFAVSHEIAEGIEVD